MTLAATCPDCGTSFKVEAGQLRQRDGLVRCGVCQCVFRATGALRQAMAQAGDDGAPAGEADRRVDGFQPTGGSGGLARQRDVGVPDPARRDRSAPPAAPAAGVAAAKGAATTGGTAAGATPATAAAQRRPARPPRPPEPFARPGSGARALLGRVLLGALVAAALLQATLVARDTLAARLPVLRPALERFAGLAGLRVALPRRLSQLTIEGFELRAGAVPAQLVMTAVLRNGGAMPVQWPAMELTLADESDRVVVRRALLPADYLRGTPRAADAGIGARSELPVRLLLEAPASRAARYTVSLFYP